jgi:hypothetical protein
MRSATISDTARGIRQVFTPNWIWRALRQVAEFNLWKLAEDHLVGAWESTRPPLTRAQIGHPQYFTECGTTF